MNDKHIKVLLIEDNPGDARLIREMVAEVGGARFDLECVDRLSTALERLAAGGIDVVLLDLGLPDSTGFDTFTKVYAQSPEAPIVVLTGLDDEALAVEAVREGAQDYLTKGQVDGNLLVRAMKYAIERKRAEEELRDSEERFRDLYENAPSAYFSVGEDGVIHRCNRRAEELLGRTIEEFVGLPVFELYADTPQGKEKASKVLQRFRSGETIIDEELQMQKADGALVWISLTVNALRDDRGQVVESRSMVVDITERKWAEEELRQSYVQLQRTLEGTIQTLVSAIELRDPYTAGHQRRVTRLACVIANELGLPQEQIEGLRMAGLIHDLGKIAVPAEILSKLGELNDIEYGLIKAHSQIGHDVLKEIEFSWQVAEIVLHHHERLDGSGYPQGLVGEEIMLEARILAVADVVEAMSSHRPYRPAHGTDKALEEISQNRGALYDPEAVDVCLELFTEKGFAFGGRDEQ